MNLEEVHIQQNQDGFVTLSRMQQDKIHRGTFRESDSEPSRIHLDDRSGRMLSERCLGHRTEIEEEVS